MELIYLLLITVILMLILTIGILTTMVLCDQETADERARLAECERQLRVAWEALEQTQRINEAFWRTRTTMRNEALRQLRGMTGNTDQTPR